jgi:hypothetical protein
MNNQQQVDKKRHGSKIMRSKSLNVTATSLIFPFFAKFRSEHKKRERERENGTRTNEKKQREERKREKNGIFLFGNGNRN